MPQDWKQTLAHAVHGAQHTETGKKLMASAGTALAGAAAAAPLCPAVVVATGRIEQTIGGDTQVMNEGDAAIIPRGVMHSAKPLSPGTVVVVVLFGEGTQYESQEQAK